jgi:hypothetical protein
MLKISTVSLIIFTSIVFIRPPPWSSGQSSWLQIQRSGFDSRRYHTFWRVESLKRGPLNLVSTIEELLERKSSGSVLEIQEYRRRDLSRWPRGTVYPQKLALTSTTSGGRSVGIVRSRTQATKYSICKVLYGYESLFFIARKVGQQSAEGSEYLKIREVIRKYINSALCMVLLIQFN